LAEGEVREVLGLAAEGMSMGGVMAGATGEDELHE